MSKCPKHCRRRNHLQPPPSRVVYAHIDFLQWVSLSWSVKYRQCGIVWVQMLSRILVSLQSSMVLMIELLTTFQAEEVQHAARTAPRTMLWAYLINIPVAFAMLLVFLFCITDVAAATETSFPFVWVLQNSLSTGGAQAITALMFIVLFGLEISCFASTSRQAFAFARDDGLPFANWMKKVAVLPLTDG